MCRVYSGGSCIWPIPIGSSSEPVAASPALHLEWYRTPSYPIHLSEVIHKTLRLIARIPLIQRRKKHRSREEKVPSRSGFSSVYARSLKDQARQSKYPRT